ncbi:MAG: hypothetical protein HOD92_18415, partial [Deltaproteobacteria bacterium]|nr:hypothetical protein [Deltaproteobacteria bacterium]
MSWFILSVKTQPVLSVFAKLIKERLKIMKKKKMTPDDFYSVDSPPIPTEIIRKMRPVRKKFPDMPRFIRSHTIGDVEEWKKELTPRGPQKAPTKTKV